MVCMARRPYNHLTHLCGFDDCPPILHVFHHLHANTKTKHHYDGYCVHKDRFNILKTLYFCLHQIKNKNYRWMNYVYATRQLSSDVC